MLLAAAMATLGIPLYVLPAQDPGDRVHQLSTCAPDESFLYPMQSYRQS